MALYGTMFGNNGFGQQQRQPDLGDMWQIPIPQPSPQPMDENTQPPVASPIPEPKKGGGLMNVDWVEFGQ